MTLTGTVEDRGQKRAAEDAASRVRGVKDVNNQIRVSQREMAAAGSGSSGGSRAGGASSATSGSHSSGS